MRIAACIVSLFLIAGTASAQPANWMELPPPAKDIGVGGGGATFIIGTEKVHGGYGIHRWNGARNAWEQFTTGGGVRIDVDQQGNPWVVNEFNDVYRWDGTRWAGLPGKATDIGIGADGTAWVVGANSEIGGYGIYRWVAKAGNWEKVPGSALRIAVDGYGDAWVVTSANAVYRYSKGGCSYGGKGWLIPICTERGFHLLPGEARDIRIGPDGNVYALGVDGRIHQWHEECRGGTAPCWIPR